MFLVKSRVLLHKTPQWMTHDLLQLLQGFISFKTAVHIRCQQYTEEMNKGFMQTGIYRCQLCKRTSFQLEFQILIQPQQKMMMAPKNLRFL